MRRTRALLAVLTLLATAAVTGCSGSDGSGGADGTSGGAPEGISGITVAGDVGTAPKVSIKAPLALDSTESYTAVTGDGSPASEGEQVLLHLFVANGSTGKKAASTYDTSTQGSQTNGQPVALRLEADQVFASVVKALVGVPSGSRVVVAATPEDAYGKTGAAQLGIKPKDDVVFVVDLVATEPAKVLKGPRGKAVEPDPSLPQLIQKDGQVTGFDFSGAAAKPPTSLQVIPLVQGTGPVARKDSLVTFDYLGEVYGAQAPFDESFSKEPVTFPLGVGGLIPAWDSGLVGVHQGSRVLIIAPPAEGYGSSGNPTAGIKGTDTLVFVVDVLGVS